MKYGHAPPLHASQSAHLSAYLVISLVFLGMFTSASESAETDALTGVIFPADYSVPASWKNCVGLNSNIADSVQPNCTGDPEFDDEESVFSDSRDRKGLRRDTWYFLGYQAVTIGILYAMPESVSGWTDEQKEGYSMSIWWDNVTHPQIDSDDFYINYILHPYWGAAYFVRARERGYSDVESFWYAVLLSSAYEFGAEALFEEPSIQDIIVTPVGGALVGMYFMNVRDNIREREIALGKRTTKDRWLWVLTDPLGSLNRKFDKLFGWETELQVRPYSYVRRRDLNMPYEPAPWNDDRVYGIEFRLRW